MIFSDRYQSLQDALRMRFMKVHIQDGRNHGSLIDLSELISSSRFDFNKAELYKDTKQALLVGLIFINPKSNLMQHYFCDRMEYLDVRSGKACHFFWAGYSFDTNRRIEEEPRFFGRIRTRDPRISLEYSELAFDRFRKDIESMSRWRYSGGADLILTTAKIGQIYDRDVHLDFSSAICLELHTCFPDPVPVEMNISLFLERIFRAAEADDCDNPVWKLSDSEGFHKGATVLRDWVFSLLPAKLGNGIADISRLAIRDISR